MEERIANLLQFSVIMFIMYLILYIIVFATVGFPDVINIQQCLKGESLGFWYGLWHGWIVPISFIGSLFDNDIALYAVNNNGSWYNFGFVLGSGSFISRVISNKKK